MKKPHSFIEGITSD